MTVTRQPEEDDVSMRNHIRKRLRSRTFVREAIEVLSPIYGRGVPTAAVCALTAYENDLSEQATLDALDHMERGGDIYQSCDGHWKVTQV